MKSSNLTIRIPFELKEAFKKKAESEGKNASEVLMQFIADYVDIQGAVDQSALERRVARIENILEKKLEASLGELVA